MQKADAVQQWESLSSDPLMRLSEIAEGFRLSGDTLRRWVRSGKLQAVKLGGTYKVRRSRVLALLESENPNE